MYVIMWELALYWKSGAAASDRAETHTHTHTLKLSTVCLRCAHAHRGIKCILPILAKTYCIHILHKHERNFTLTNNKSILVKVQSPVHSRAFNFATCGENYAIECFKDPKNSIRWFIFVSFTLISLGQTLKQRLVKFLPKKGVRITCSITSSV